MFNHNSNKPATERQKRLIKELGVPIPEYLSAHRAHLLIDAHKEQRNELPATDLQQTFLYQWSAWREGMKRGEANDLIEKIKSLNQESWE